ncbi:nonstructural protein [Capybara microvirus Cap1_SP_142]|nr:nonstructural protein [Capybara microvirus Cap1_SP_142]
MKLNVYVIFDHVSNSAHMQPLYAKEDELILRTVKSANLGELVEGNLQDFALYKIGLYDDEELTLKQLEKPYLLCNLSALKKEDKEND